MKDATTEGDVSPRPIRVLLVASEEDFVEFLRHLLSQESFMVFVAENMISGLAKAQVDWPSLIIARLSDPEEIVQLCRSLKGDRGTSNIPIIVVSEAGEISDRIAGLEAGADDYVSQPCNPREIVLRAKAALRRSARTLTEEHFVRGPIRVDPARCRVSIENKQIHLTPVEFKLLRTLVRQPGAVQSREALLREARGNGELLESRTIDTHIRRLRRKLGKAAHLVETIRGSGYRLRPT